MGTFGLGGLHRKSTWLFPVATFAALPPTAVDGSVAVALDTNIPYEYDAALPGWVPFATGGGGPTGPAGGDLAGTYPNPTVRQSSTEFALTADITPPAILANTNDYAPAGLPTASFLRLSAATPGFNLTGLTGGTDGRIITIHNVGSFPITLTDEGAGSSSTNRFALPTDIPLSPDVAVTLQYDAISARWRMVGTTAATPIGPAGGDLAGAYPNPTLSQRGAAPGDVLTWDTGAGDFIPKPPTAASFDPDTIVTADYTDVFNTEGDEVPLVVIDDNGNVVVDG